MKSKTKSRAKPLRSTRFAIVVSRFNESVTSGLLKGAQDCFRAAGFLEKNIDVIEAPGAFEIPLLAQRLAQTGRYTGIVCLGCVIKGDTAHFECISLGATLGIQLACLNSDTPITFGILATYDERQAWKRSRSEGPLAPENKGREAAAACLESACMLESINSLARP